MPNGASSNLTTSQFTGDMQTSTTLKTSKDHVDSNEMKFLSHIITPKGIRTDSDKCERIANWSIPTSTEQLSSFAELASHYWTFARLQESLLLCARSQCKDVFFRSQECDEGFFKPKTLLMTMPILALPTVGNDT